MFRQSKLVLVRRAPLMALVAAVGCFLVALLEQWPWLGVALLLALVPLARPLACWWCFRVLVDEHTLTVCALEGWALKRWVVPLDTPEGFMLRQPLAAVPFDLGDVIIHTNGRSVHVR